MTSTVFNASNSCWAAKVPPAEGVFGIKRALDWRSAFPISWDTPHHWFHWLMTWSLTEKFCMIDFWWTFMELLKSGGRKMCMKYADIFRSLFSKNEWIVVCTDYLLFQPCDAGLQPPLRLCIRVAAKSSSLSASPNSRQIKKGSKKKTLFYSKICIWMLCLICSASKDFQNWK